MKYQVCFNGKTVEIEATDRKDAVSKAFLKDSQQRGAEMIMLDDDKKSRFFVVSSNDNHQLVMARNRWQIDLASIGADGELPSQVDEILVVKVSPPKQKPRRRQQVIVVSPSRRKPLDRNRRCFYPTTKVCPNCKWALKGDEDYCPYCCQDLNNLSALM